MAKQYARMKGCANPSDVVCLDGAYHGHVQSIVDISPYKWGQCTDGERYHKEHVHVVSIPDTYRGVFTGDRAGEDYAEEVSKIVTYTGGVGCFIHESIMGCGGQIEMPKGYLEKAYRAVREKGGLVIADEVRRSESQRDRSTSSMTFLTSSLWPLQVQTGFGRPGENFWQFQSNSKVRAANCLATS